MKSLANLALFKTIARSVPFFPIHIYEHLQKIVQHYYLEY